ncbi:MAG TPA: hypothetical protein VGR57_08630 [Ktedonobacterales bacterium]|nr:hypothetical protein [Ktedonobacterales bacterium]
MNRRPLKRPPAAGEMKRLAEAQAPALRAQVRTLMTLDGLTAEQVATAAGVDVAALALFLEGAALNPRWQERLATWAERAGTEGQPEQG